MKWKFWGTSNSSFFFFINLNGGFMKKIFLLLIILLSSFNVLAVELTPNAKSSILIDFPERILTVKLLFMKKMLMKK